MPSLQLTCFLLRLWWRWCHWYGGPQRAASVSDKKPDDGWWGGIHHRKGDRTPSHQINHLSTLHFSCEQACVNIYGPDRWPIWAPLWEQWSHMDMLAEDPIVILLQTNAGKFNKLWSIGNKIWNAPPQLLLLLVLLLLLAYQYCYYCCFFYYYYSFSLLCIVLQTDSSIFVCNDI